MSPPVQAASIAAWNDEAHVVENRTLYRDKFAQVTARLRETTPVAMPRSRVLSVAADARSRYRVRPRPVR